MKKYLYDLLCHDFVKSIQKEIVFLEEEFPEVTKDVQCWTYQGKGIRAYESVRQMFVTLINKETDANKKEELRFIGTKILYEAAKWFALQFLLEEAYRDKISKEVAINMLKNSKYQIKEVIEIMPYMDEMELKELEKQLNVEKIKMEVLLYR